MRPDSGLDSPLSSTRSSPQYYYSQTNLKRQSYPPAGLPAYNSPTENHSPACYYSPQQQHAPPPYERQIQTPPMATPMSVAPPSASNPWQHHHHSSPNSQAAFPQSQDRYICPTCSKAFSRPSSLRIHSHSHTGEKPFKCPHHGCGKAFSVRSNMKRHERGCHQWDINRFINRFCIIWYKSKRSKCTLIICIKSSLFSFSYPLRSFCLDFPHSLLIASQKSGIFQAPNVCLILETCLIIPPLLLHITYILWHSWGYIF